MRPRNVRAPHLAAVAWLTTTACYKGLDAQNANSAGSTADSSSEGASLGDSAGDQGVDVSDGSGAVPGTSGGGSSDAGPVATDTGSDSAADTTTGDDGPPPSEYAPAVDITAVAVIVNQGTAIRIADNGTVIDPPERVAPLVHSRRSLMFVTWQLARTFTPRPIRAELLLDRGGGDYETLASEVMVAGPSGGSPLDPHFSFTIEPGQIPEGTRWSLSLHELAPNTPDAVSPPRLPASGTAPFESEDGEQRIRMVVVPYRHQYAGCNRVPPTDAATLEAFRLRMEALLPTQSVEFTLHAEVTFTESMATGDAVLMDTTALRAAEAPEPDVHYFGLLSPCDPSTSYGGLAWQPSIPGGLETAQYRASIGIWYDFDPEFSYDTMAHEVSHNHGRAHVACAGTEAMTDPDYPNAGGAIASDGWSIHDGMFRPPTFADYMSYCADVWVSPYGWSWMLEVIDDVTELADAAAPPKEEGAGALAVAINGDQVTSARWLPGIAPSRREGDGRLVRSDGTQCDLAWERVTVADTTTTFVIVDMPIAEWLQARELRLDVGSTAVTVPRAQMRR